MSAPTELVPGLWRWTGRHPHWHPGAFGAEVGSYAVVAGDDLLLIDPLVLVGDDAGPAPASVKAGFDEEGGNPAAGEHDPDADAQGQAAAEALIDELAEGRSVHVLITVGYHVRSAERLCAKHDASLHGPKTAATRLGDASKLQQFLPGFEGPGGVLPFAVGKPGRAERPLWLPSHRAIAFGDLVVRRPDDALVLWDSNDSRSDGRLRFYRDTFNPTFAPILELPIEHVLTTHGEPVIGDGHAALQGALEAEPWFYVD